MIEAALRNGTCNVLVSDVSQIYGSDLQADLDIGTYAMSNFHVSVNRLSVVTRAGNAGDGEWSNVIEGTRHGLSKAVQIGLGLDPAACQKILDDPDRGSGPISFLDPVRCVGNYAEIFGRSLSTKILGSSSDDFYAQTIDAPNLGSLRCKDCENVLLSSPSVKEIVDRGGLRCGIYMDQERNYTKTSLPVLMAETYCTAVAVAIFQGDRDAVNITHFTEIDYSVFPDEFDVVAGVEAVFIREHGRLDHQDFEYDPEEPSPWSMASGYFLEDKYHLDGVEYNGVGKGRALAIRKTDEDDGLAYLIGMVFVATVHAQRIGIDRSTSYEMPLFELLGNGLTFMLKDVIAFAGNYDEVLADALRASDGQIGRGWNSIIKKYEVTFGVPTVWCSLSGSCPHEVWGKNIGLGFYLWDSNEIPDESELMVLENLGGWLGGNEDDPFV